MNSKRNTYWKDVSDDEWGDWHWQVKNRIVDPKHLMDVLGITEAEKGDIQECLKALRMAITPYYASLIDPNDPQCPIRMQAVPTKHELDFHTADMEDPLAEDVDSPVPLLTHRYPDRVLLLVTDQCSMYCRHCTRRRYAGHNDKASSMSQIQQAIDYIRKTPQVRDVIISGGDPLTLGNKRLKEILDEIHAIEHVEMIRIGSRTPVVCPQRITDELVSLLRQYQPLYINTHFNHPKEITPESAKACAKLADAGIPLNNQTVLLRGVNDCPYIQRKLSHELLKIRVRPYYLFQCDLSAGIEHFRTSVAKGIEIIELMRGHTSGMAVPTYIIDTPGGGGKVPVQPNYILSHASNKIILRNFEGSLCAYSEPKDARQSERQLGKDCEPDGQDVHSGVAELMMGKKVHLVPNGVTRGSGWTAGEKAK